MLQSCFALSFTIIEGFLVIMLLNELHAHGRIPKVVIQGSASVTLEEQVYS